MLAKHARRWPFALLLLAVPIAGAWFGEDLSQSLPSLFALMSSVAVTIAISIATPWSPARRVGAGCAAFALFWFGWAMGQSEARDAYNDAVQRGEWLRGELAHYYARTGGYLRRSTSSERRSQAAAF